MLKTSTHLYFFSVNLFLIKCLKKFLVSHEPVIPLMVFTQFCWQNIMCNHNFNILVQISQFWATFLYQKIKNKDRKALK